MTYQKLTIDDFDALYKILQEHFPEKEQKEYNYMKQAIIQGKINVIVQKEEGTIIGALCYVLLDAYAFIDYLVIVNQHQGKRLGEKILQHFISLMDRPIVLEVELPDTPIAKRRIAFYQRQNFILNEYYYEVPENGLRPTCTFLLMTYPRAISQEEFDILYPQLMLHGYGIEGG